MAWWALTDLVVEAQKAGGLRYVECLSDDLAAAVDFGLTLSFGRTEL